MPGKKTPGPSIKKPATYEALRDKGDTEQESFRYHREQAVPRRL